MQTTAILWSVFALAVLGCDSPAGDDTGEGDSSAGETGDAGGVTDAGTDGEPVVCEQVPLACVDAAIQDLSLQEKVSAGAVVSARDGDDWRATIDASAGGTMNAAMNAWVYMRFTDDGLEKLELDDVAALTSSDWDIAAKRYGIRVNSGSSGPSCVTVAAGAGDYAALTDAPADAAFAAESYYTAECTLIADDHMLGDPAYRMSGWWAYQGCVQTTLTPYVLRLADGRALKLVVEAYYAEGQAACNDGDTMGTGSAQLAWRWRFL